MQILANLLSNAIKFTNKGFIEFGYNLIDKEIQFYVKDTGIGIAPEFHETIFKRFGQLEQNGTKLYRGTGLGLSISKEFVGLLGGEIWVESIPEIGSTFYFTIPYKPVNKQENMTELTTGRGNVKTVLVAEDEEYNYLFIEQVLLKNGYKVIHAKTGREAIDIYKTEPHIHLILMDIKMPIMSGDEAAKILKSLIPTY
ncbi:MAG: response regulator [Chloroflexia bacterium]|nr:response regulator [Chloroflexia bacterium]